MKMIFHDSNIFFRERYLIVQLIHQATHFDVFKLTRNLSTGDDFEGESCFL